MKRLTEAHYIPSKPPILLKKVLIPTNGKVIQRKVYLTRHGEDRFSDRDRFEKLALDKQFMMNVLNVTKRAMIKIVNEYQEKVGEYGVHSNSTGIGLVLAWRKDDFDKLDTKNNAYIVSILPIKPVHYFKDVVAELMVEKFLKSVLIESKKKKGYKDYKIEEKEGYIDHYFEDGIKIIFVDGKLYEHNLNGIIFVD